MTAWNWLPNHIEHGSKMKNKLLYCPECKEHRMHRLTDDKYNDDGYIIDKYVCKYCDHVQYVEAK